MNIVKNVAKGTLGAGTVIAGYAIGMIGRAVVEGIDFGAIALMAFGDGLKGKSLDEILDNITKRTKER